MRLENSFEVPASPERAWALLLDVPRVVPCMPGAELTETVDDAHWKAQVQVKFGPVALTFAADVSREAVDEAARSITLVTKARETKGRGAAGATIESSLAPAAEGTRVTVVTDLQLSGAAAQFGGPVVKDVAAQMTRQFADCLQGQLGEEPAPAQSTRPISGLSLLLRSLAARFRR
ncbi:MAG TPA: SRPBCC family protein [Gaiellaceae bacterium]|nr:SRPBCC family protein [Gaiellaceae bacterium]